MVIGEVPLSPEEQKRADAVSESIAAMNKHEREMSNQSVIPAITEVAIAPELQGEVDALVAGASMLYYTASETNFDAPFDKVLTTGTSALSHGMPHPPRPETESTQARPSAGHRALHRRQILVRLR